MINIIGISDVVSQSVLILVINSVIFVYLNGHAQLVGHSIAILLQVVIVQYIVAHFFLRLEVHNGVIERKEELFEFFSEFVSRQQSHSASLVRV